MSSQCYRYIAIYDFYLMLLNEGSEIEVYDKELVSVCKSMQEIFLFMFSNMLYCISQIYSILISMCTHSWKTLTSAHSLVMTNRKIHTLLFNPNQNPKSQ